MARRSELSKLPVEVLEHLDAWLGDPNITQLEATNRFNDLLTELGMEDKLTNKSAVGRRDKWLDDEFEKAAEKTRIRIEMREHYKEMFDDDNLDEAGRQIGSLLYSTLGQISAMMVNMETDKDNYAKNAIVIKTLTSAAKDLENTLSENRKRTEAIKLQARQEAQAEAAITMKKVAQEKGVSDDLAEAIYSAMTESFD